MSFMQFLYAVVIVIVSLLKVDATINLPAPGNTATRALGITNLKISTTISTTLYETCAWTYGSKQETFYAKNFGGCLTPSNAEVAVTCTDNGGAVTSQIRFIQAINASFNLTVQCDGIMVSLLTVIIQDCSSPTPNNVSVNPSSGVYNTQANFQCSHGSTLFNMNGTPGNTATKCLATAEWENEKIVQCWSAPTTTLIGNNTICAGNIVTFQCTASGGVPSLDRVEIYFNQQKQTLVGNTWTINSLSSSNNGDVVECRAINNYTAMQEYTNLGRDNKTLIVHYAAEGFAVNDGTTSHSNICTWYIAPPGPRSCTITFSLNPTTHTTTLTKDGAMVTNDATNQSKTSTSQSFVFTRNQPSFNDSGNYTLKINNGKLENTFTFNISVINEVQPTPPPPPILPPDNLGVIIGAAVGGVVAFILIIILVVYCLKKQRNKKQDASSPADRGENGDNNFQGREEVDNPLYATSGLHNSAHGGSKDNSHDNPSFDAGSEKEEVVNPLYATSSSNGAKKKTKGGDTYSEVKKKSKNKSEKEEKVNPLYGSSDQPGNAEGAYAEVDKKGKKSKPTKEEKTNPLYVSSGPPDGIDGAYAEVDKKKKKGKKGKGEKEEKVNPLYVSSDQPKVEEAYAEVDKKKKGKKGKGEKEEKVNPLYVPSDQPDKVEDAYAEVDKKKNKKKSGKGEKEEKVNPLYVPSDQPDKVEDAYAEVDKKKSKKMKPPPDNPYAEVTGELHGKTNNIEVARPLTSSKKVKPPVPVKPKMIKPNETAQLHSNC